MFVFTAKMDKKKILVAFLLLLVVVAAILIICVVGGDKGRAVETLSETAVIRTNEDRVAYLSSLGWTVEPEPVEEKDIVIPEEFTDVYREYNSIQLRQGFDLTQYAGAEATRYTYTVTNYPDATDPVVADIIIYRGRVIAGDIQSVMLDGFMGTLEYPKG